MLLTSDQICPFSNTEIIEDNHQDLAGGDLSGDLARIVKYFADIQCLYDCLIHSEIGQIPIKHVLIKCGPVNIKATYHVDPVPVTFKF